MSLREQIRVVELALVPDYMRVGPSRRHEVVVADQFADPRPRHPAQMEQADAAVAQIVFRALPIVALPGYSRPLIRVRDYLALLDKSTFDGRTRVRG